MDTIHWLVNHMVGLNSGISFLYQPVIQGLESEGAREDQIDDVQSILREELSRKLIWLLADMLNQPGRLLNGLQMLRDVAQNIHGLKTDSIRQLFINDSDTDHDPSSLSIKGQSLRGHQSDQDKSVNMEDAGGAKQSPNTATRQAAHKEQPPQELTIAQPRPEDSKAPPARCSEPCSKDGGSSAMSESSGVN